MATDISVLAEGLRIFGGQRYNIASFFEIVKNKKRTAKLVVDGVEREDNFAFIIACNTKYVGKDMKMAPSAEIDDGKIDLIIVKEASSNIKGSLELELVQLYIAQDDIDNAKVRLESIVSDYPRTQTSAEAYWKKKFPSHYLR